MSSTKKIRKQKDYTCKYCRDSLEICCCCCGLQDSPWPDLCSGVRYISCPNCTSYEQAKREWDIEQERENNNE